MENKMTPITNKQIDELLEMESKATPGPWTVDMCGDVITRAIVEFESEEAKAFGAPLFKMIGTTPTAPYNPDGMLIPASRNVFRQVLEELKESREVIGFYAKKESWIGDTVNDDGDYICDTIQSDWEKIRKFIIGGKRARAHLAKYAVKE